MSRKTNRREFIKTTALAGAGLWVGRSGQVFALGIHPRRISPNEKLNVAAIGAGGMGGGDIASIGKTENVVALCDVDENRAAESFKRFPSAKRYTDFRKMFDEMGNQIDACNVSTPDHTHAVAAMWAMKLGKHVYVQKPLTHDVYEARELTKAAAKYKVATQMGNQGTANPGLREAVEVIRAGTIGPVREVHVWTNRPVWPQGIKKRPPGQPVPKTLNWDLWLGTAPWREYNEAYLPFKWRGWYDFGTGALGDMACHTANMPFMALKLGYPTSVEPVKTAEMNDETYPLWSVIEYQFPARGDMPPVKWTWYDGGNDKPAWVNERLRELAHGMKIPDSGCLLIGDKGVLFSPDDYGAEYKLLPEKDFEGFQPPAPTLPRSPGHYAEWINACKGGPPAMSNFSYSGPLTETVVLGCVALRAGHKIEWDGPNMRITNDRDANKLLRREYRKGWHL